MIAGMKAFRSMYIAPVGCACQRSDSRKKPITAVAASMRRENQPHRSPGPGPWA